MTGSSVEGDIILVNEGEGIVACEDTVVCEGTAALVGEDTVQQKENI